jgi:protein TonB
VRPAQLVSSVPPEYPLVAKNAHQQGVVVVSAMIGVDGKVKSASAVSGPGLLQKAAVDAVRQWVYKPTTLNGAPVESETRVEVKFQTGR